MFVAFSTNLFIFYTVIDNREESVQGDPQITPLTDCFSKQVREYERKILT